MAEIKKRGRSWTVRWWEEDDRGARRRRRRSFPRKGQATAFAHQVEAEKARVAAGLVAAPMEPKRLADVVEHLEAGRWKELTSANTLRGVWRNHIEPALGHLVLKDITTERVERFGAGLTGMKPKTKKNILAILRSLLRKAWKLSWLPLLPHVEMPRINEEEMSFLGSLEEVAALMEAARVVEAGVDLDEEQRPERELLEDEGLRLATLYGTAAMTGMRAGELAGLRRRDIDFKRRQITVARTYTDRPTKSRRIRHIPLLDALVPLLRRWLASNPLDVVFPTDRGTPMQPSDRRFQEHFHKALAIAKLPRMRFHDLRHTFAALWLGAGGDIYRLCRILGHSSVQVTERYSHLARDAWASELGRLGQGPTESPPPPPPADPLAVPAANDPAIDSSVTVVEVLRPLRA